MNRNLLGVISLFLLLAEALLIILSWLLSATMMEGVRSLLSSEGIRWYFGSFTYIMASPLLVWLLLVLSAVGCFQKSGAEVLFGRQPLTYRERVALRVALVFLCLYLLIIALLNLKGVGAKTVRDFFVTKCPVNPGGNPPTSSTGSASGAPSRMSPIRHLRT